MEDIQVTPTTTTPTAPIEVSKQYPMVEEMTFKCPVSSEAQAYDLLIAIQFLVNQVSASEIISTVEYISKNPSMIQKAKKYLPYLKML